MRLNIFRLFPVETPVETPGGPSPNRWWIYPVGAVLLTIAFVLKPTTAEAPTPEFKPQPIREPEKTDPSPKPDEDNDDEYVYRAMEMDADGKPNVPWMGWRQLMNRQLLLIQLKQTQQEQQEKAYRQML